MAQQRIAHISWIRPPIAKSVDQAKLAMETYVTKRHEHANPPAGAEISWVVNRKHDAVEAFEAMAGIIDQIHCALSTVESPGGSALSLELQIVCSNMRQGIIGPEVEDQALIAVQSGLMMLPGYLGMVIGGAPDSPGILAKYINEIRELRKVPLLAGEDLLPASVAFAYVTPPHQLRDVSDRDVSGITANASTEFQQGFAEYLSSQSPDALSRMRKALRSLQEVTRDIEVGCAWWVGECLLEVIGMGGIRSSGTTLSNIRMLSVAIQKQATAGEKAAHDALGVERFRTILYALSITTQSSAAVTAALKVFGVGRNVDSDALKALQERLDATHAANLADVIPELKPQLDTSMISFGRALSAKTPAGFDTQITACRTALRVIGNVFSMVQEDELAAAANLTLSLLKSVESSDDITTDLTEKVKNQILFLDQRLDSLEANDAARVLSIQGVSADVITAVVKESLKELIGVRKQIAIHVGSGSNDLQLKTSIEALSATASAFDFAGNKYIANLISGVAYGLVGLVDNGRLAETDQLQLAARALVTIEMYFDALDQKLTPDAGLLERAEAALQDMGVTVERVQQVSTHELLAKFNQAQEQTTEDVREPLLIEIFELRPSFDAVLSNLDLHNRPRYEALHTASTRLAMAAELVGFQNFVKICLALAAYAKVAPNNVNDPSFNQHESQELIREGCQMVLRCMDEYASRGDITLFTKTVTDELLKVCGPLVSTQRDDLVEATVLIEEPAVREYPEGCDPVLMNIARMDYDEHFATLINFCVGSDHCVTEPLCIAVHTLTGVSGYTKCSVLHRVFGALEQNLFAHKANESHLSSADVALLHELLLETKAYQEEFPWVTETELGDAWVQIASTIGVSRTPAVLQQGVSLEANEASFSTDVAVEDEPPVEAAQFSHAKTISEHDVGYASTQVASQQFVSTPKPTHMAVAPEPEIEYDLEMATYYLDDASEVLPVLSTNAASFLDNLDDSELLASIKRSMHTLKGAASIAEAHAIRDLTHHMESLFDAVMAGLIEAGPDCATLLGVVLSAIEHMTADIRINRGYNRPAVLIDFVEECCELNRIDLADLNARHSKADEVIAMPMAPSASASASEPDVGRDAVNSAAPGASVVEAVQKPLPENPQPDGTESTGSGVRRGSRGGRRKALRKAHQAALGAAKADGESVETTDEIGQNLDVVALPENAAVAETRTETMVIEPEAPVPVTPQPVATSSKAIELPKAQVVELRQRQEPEAKQGLNAENITLAEQLNRESSVERRDITSSSVLSMLARIEANATQESSSQRRRVTTEKIKVDQRLLENSIEMASELSATRHRQQAQHEELMLSLWAIRERLSLHHLSQKKFTSSLRGYINRPTVSQENDGEELQLERFNHLSAMNVQNGVQIETILQEVEEVIEQGQTILASFKHQAQLVGNLQRDLMDSRLVPFKNIRQALQKVVDTTSQALRKPLQIEFHGSDTIMDKVLLERVSDPLTHVLKNAIDHGFETQSERLAAGKPAQGCLEVSVLRRAKTVSITVTDDGRGIDPQKIRAKAIEKGLIGPEDKYTDRELVHMITLSGFTTTTIVSQISGRGVGMDIVKAAVEQVGGQLRIESVVGKGTTFTMELPFTIGANRAMVCKAGAQWFAIPCYTITQIISSDRSALDAQRRQKGHAIIDYDGEGYNVVSLADLIAMPDLKLQSVPSGSTTLLLCSHGDTRIAIEVDKDCSMPEIHVKKLGGILSRLKGVIGETEIHDGSPVLVLDVMEMARYNLTMTDKGYEVRLNRIRSQRREQKPLAFIVDDASSYRTLLSQHFEARGFNVALARDGQNALDMLPLERMPDVVIVDLEMPRLDGFGLTTALRARREFDSVPIIMLTTRTGLEERAYNAGVSYFLNKPYNSKALDEAVSKALPGRILDAAV